jgi:hypothetical protein
MYADSRYYNGQFIVAHDAKRMAYRTAVLRTFPTSTVSFFYYSWTEGDRIDVVAHKLFNEASLWWTIMDYNPEIIDPLNIPPGTLLRIPNV